MEAANNDEKYLIYTQYQADGLKCKAHDVTVPNPPMKKNSASRSNEDCEGEVISSGVFAISRAKRPNPVEKRTDDAKEHDHGP